jgi:ubiquinone biosynthesis protein COQ4
MLDHPVGRQILAEKPQITPETLPLEKLLQQYPPGTLGHEYAEFMSSHGFGSDNRPSVRFIDDPELAYVMTRYRQVHDFWHVLSGLETDVFGEIALKWFEFMQTGLPMAALSTMAFPFKLSLKEQAILTRVYLPWAVECSKSCVFLMNVYYEQILDRNVVELREEFGFVKPPRQSNGHQ